MISRSDLEALPKPTLSPFARGHLSLCRCFTAAACGVSVCMGVCLLCGCRWVHSLIINQLLAMYKIGKINCGSASAGVAESHEMAPAPGPR